MLQNGRHVIGVRYVNILELCLAGPCLGGGATASCLVSTTPPACLLSPHIHFFPYFPHVQLSTRTSCPYGRLRGGPQYPPRTPPWWQTITNFGSNRDKFSLRCLTLIFDNLVAFWLAAPSKVAYLIHKTLTQDRFVLGPQQVSSDMCEKKYTQWAWWNLWI